MTVDEIAAELRSLDRLPASRAKAERLESLAEQAQAAGDRRLEAWVLADLCSAHAYSAERDKLPLTMSRLLRLVDQNPAEVGDAKRRVYWQLKWMTGSLIFNPAVPLPVVYRWLDEFESRYRQQGYSLRPVRASRSQLAQHLGDKALAGEMMEASIAAERDSMSDCHACERNSWGSWRESVGDDAGALGHWGPVLDGTHTCSEEPHYVLAGALLPLLRLGRLDEARGAFLRGYPMVRGNINLRGPVAQHIEFCALTGNEARGLEILAEHSAWLDDADIDVSKRADFLEGVVVLLRRLSALEHGDLPVSGSFTVAELLAAYELELRELCGRYDARNGNSAFSERVAERVARQPLVEHLPLGLPSRLPAAAAFPGVAGGVTSGVAGGSALDALIARATELDAAHHPEAEKAWQRVAAASGSAHADLPSGAALKVAEVQASRQMLDDPTMGRTGLLKVADSFVAAGDQGGAFRARATAARALSLTDDRAAALPEAAALVAAASTAFGEGTLTARQYLAMRTNEHMIAVHLLGMAEARDKADLDAAADAVVATLAEAERYGEAHTAARSHELLSQLDHWRGDDASAVGRARAARENYLAADEPWYAAAASVTLAQFALRDGDAAAAEEHTRFALANAVDLEPDNRAGLASLLVESLLAQKDRDLDIADAALNAAARWDGISEPDTLHNTFHAARAYASLGRHAEACALFAQAIPRVAVPYDGTGIAMTHEKYGHSLRATGQHEAAAAQFLEAARAIADDPNNARAHAFLAAAAAESLRQAGEGEASLVAFQRAADLHGNLGDTVNQVRAQRSAAWLQHWMWDREAAAGDDPGVTAMRAVLGELERLVAADKRSDLAPELKSTQEQLAEMLESLANEDD
jgi:tetratricopeptide (TPR) repeat protein